MELATSQPYKNLLPQIAPEHPNIDCAGTAIPAAFCGEIMEHCNIKR